MSKKNFASNVTVGSSGIDMAGIRNLAKNEPEEFVKRLQPLVESGEISWKNMGDLKSFFLATADVQVKADVTIMGVTRAVMSSAFPLLAGGMTVKGINDALEAIPTIGQDLVSDIEDNKRSTSYANIISENIDVDGVDEGKEFPLIGAGEERYDIRSKRDGRRIQITAEMIEENDVPGIVQRIDALADIASEIIEYQTLSRVFDINGSATSPAEPYVLRPNGAGVSLYQTDNDPLTRLSSSGNRYTNNALVDSTDLDNVRERLASFTNERGKRVVVRPGDALLVIPDALLGTGLKITGSALEPSIENEKNNWGPGGRFNPTIVSSPAIDYYSSSAWYYGDFKKQFKRKWKLKMETVTLQGNVIDFLRSRIAYESRVGWDVEVGAVAYQYVVQSLEGTTAP